MANPDIKVPTAGANKPEAEENANNKSLQEAQQEDLNEEYVYERSVTIKAIEKDSAYRQQNINVLGRRQSNIGSSISSTNVLCSNEGEIAAYFPNIIGLSPNNQDFHSKVKEYLSNISITVNEKITFDTTLIFAHKRDYLEFKNAEDKINTTYENTDKRDPKNLTNAIKVKVAAINKLESELYKVATPRKVTDYIMYRHCLLYNSVAKDPSVANFDRLVRFYLVDEIREKNKTAKLLRERKTAATNFIAICGNDSKFDAIFVKYCTDSHLPLADYMAKDDVDKQMLIHTFSIENPTKFNQMCSDSNIITAALIEKLIARGELVRLEYNQQITTPDGTFIGKNMNDAIAYFNSPDNKAVREAYESKIKLMKY